MVFTTEKISGFYCADREIRIYDEEGIIFYTFNNTNRIKTGFNLPTGKYITENDLKPVQKPFKYRLPKMPKSERSLNPPPNIEVIYDVNPNKCSVYLNQGIIIFDNEYKTCPKFIKTYILFHEIGHYNYGGNGEKSERNCDTYALINMLKRGYNPSQCRLANKVTLNSEFRHKACYELTKKIKHA